jgi:hypothetical protein
MQELCILQLLLAAQAQQVMQQVAKAHGPAQDVIVTHAQVAFCMP